MWSISVSGNATSEHKNRLCGQIDIVDDPFLNNDILGILA